MIEMASSVCQKISFFAFGAILSHYSITIQLQRYLNTSVIYQYIRIHAFLTIIDINVSMTKSNRIGLDAVVIKCERKVTLIAFIALLRSRIRVGFAVLNIWMLNALLLTEIVLIIAFSAIRLICILQAK